MLLAYYSDRMHTDTDQNAVCIRRSQLIYYITNPRSSVFPYTGKEHLVERKHDTITHCEEQTDMNYHCIFDLDFLCPVSAYLLINILYWILYFSIDLMVVRLFQFNSIYSKVLGICQKRSPDCSMLSICRLVLTSPSASI